MAPITRDVEAPAAVSSATNSAHPQTKSSADAPARPQPIALEVPVTVNGARTVDGSDKRVPFSESTQTVLVLPHGAVVRIAVPLASGQLVFLTNEKTKKEVVCQVVKSKSTGNAAAYVELQFTEPSAGFWGLQIPGASAGVPVPRPAPPVGAPKPTAPVSPVATKPAVPATPAPPVTPAKPPVSTPPLAQTPVAPPQSVAPPDASAETLTTTPPHVFPVPEPVKSAAPAETPRKPVVPESSVPSLEPVVHSAPISPLHDYSKDINSLFNVQAPGSPSSKTQAAPPSAAPSTEELKLQAARLQEQLSSMLFTESLSGSKTPAALPSKPAASVPDLSKKVVEISRESKPTGQNEPARKPASVISGLDDEVKVPSWLAPLSQNSETALDQPEASSASGVPANAEESFDAVEASSPHRGNTPDFGGQLLAESAASAGSVSSSGSKKGLSIGIAAAAVLAIAGSAWYFGQNHSKPVTASTLSSAAPPAASTSSEPASTSNLPAAPAASNTSSANNTSSAVLSSRPSKTSVPAPVPAVSVTTPERNESKPLDPTVGEAKKKLLGNVHLSAPVVNRGSDSQQQAGEAIQAIDSNSVSTGADPFASGEHHAPPAAPLPVGGEIKQARLIKSVPPEYPAIARTQHVSGKVEMDALIDASGKVAFVKVLSGPILLRQGALDAVKQWKYSPATLDGQPTSMHLAITVAFQGQ
ncbi:MAG: TonB family protein [Candidatus Acidiferrum sp.]